LKKVFIFLFIAAFLLFSTASGIYLEMRIWAEKPLSKSSAIIPFSIPAGQGFRTTSANLRRAGLPLNPLKFRLLAVTGGDDKKIQAGDYQLSAKMSPREILKTLQKGHARLFHLTVPEGFNLRQIASAVEKQGFGRAARFYRAATDPALIRQFSIGAASLEGYLFPDTYYFPRKTEPRKIIMTMIKRFRSVYNDDWMSRTREMGFSVHQIVTLASIIEKEAGTGAERPIISSVFHNRLKRGMRLEADPTVIYGIANFNGNLTRKDLKTPTPYNTYVIRGLPPGPIAAPGMASLEAALYPAATAYLYFVAKKDRTHYFSTNYREHQKAVRKYQLRR